MNYGNDIKLIFFVKVNNSWFLSDLMMIIIFGNQCMIVDINNGVFCCFQYYGVLLSLVEIFIMFIILNCNKVVFFWKFYN